MRKAKRTRWLLWRLRSNPLRRRDDVIEAWIMLGVWTVVVLGGTAVGAVTVQAADESFAQLRANRHSVRAVLLETAERAMPTAEGATDDRVRAKVRWTAPDGTTDTGRATVDSGLQAGSRVVIWLDDQGRIASQPPTAAQAEAQAGLLGASAALALGGLTYGAGRVARWRLDRRRTEEWGRRWDQVEPQWRRKTM
ncbi:hypothetical protein PYK79_13805 [Streptomyces sp. ID05-04B]|uniref:Rv1733c family protein n=1 Tax=unclassified Streptomyces TaxID=2593676 RepID=UPI000D1A09C2|nr:MULTISPECIES: hypothetical protein [unclassified Streptomyces]AVV44620.1 hypothetical protein C6376_27455 [Streptomyces sp. P3]MDX5564178.1 hypothetical protein [Streptomyces sp. ID05-04B]